MATLMAGLSWLAVEQWKLGVYGCWVLITGWIWAMGVAFFLRVLGGRWRTMRVIERDVAPAVEYAVPESKIAPEGDAA